MERSKNITIIFLLAVVLLVPAAPPFCFANRSSGAKQASVLLREGLYVEEVEGDLDAAIEIYGQIIADSSAQRSHIAQAMYRQGMCYLKRRDEQQAKAVFGKLVADFGDQTNVIDKVKPLLEELSNADPATLMPPETLVYVEFGSPGRQIETILNMLKGTPFENPLAAIGAGGGKSQKSGGQKSPGDIMVALMNPSMMAEFEKIRGMGIGVTGIAQDNPPAIAVLFPGKSDALRGIILATLGVIGRPVEAIEGMQAVAFPDGGGAVYDDTTVILASPKAYSAGQLTWCVRQYKGITNEPTLASSNKSFAKVSKKARQENALTIWANVDQVFADLSKLFPNGKIPQEIRIADGVADFRNIDDFIAFLSIQEDGIALEANVTFEDGHHCLAYDLIRTPNLSRAGFEAVPSEAIALFSFALGQAESAQANAARQRIENLTGLDIGREIFANVEQVTLFALPASETPNKANPAVPPIASSLGLAITSHNPQQTRRVLNQLLTVANLIAGGSAIEPADQDSGKYQIGLVNRQKLYCYMSQRSKTTVLSLNPDVIRASLSAIRGRRSALTAGPLREPLRNMAPATSKMVLINLGGAIRAADAYLKAKYDNPRNPAHKTFAQLAQACDKTSVQLRTGESTNNFSLRLSVDRLPPLDNVFPLLFQLRGTDLTAKAKAIKSQPIDETVAVPATKPESSWTPPGVDATSGRLIGWWKLDETTGRTAQDSSGDGHNGTLQGDPVWRPAGGKVVGALEFDGDGDCVKIAKESDFDLTRQITVAAWIQAREFGEGRRAIVTKGGSAWRLHRNLDTNSVRFNITYGYQPSAIGKVNVNDGQWHHVVGTYDGAKICLYVDGRLDNSLEVSSKIGTNNAPVYIGGHSEQADRCWNGLIDDVRIYSYALSQDEVVALSGGE